MIKIYDSSLVELASINSVMSMTRTEQINGNNVLSFSLPLTTALTALINDTNIIGLDSDYFDIAKYTKQQQGGGFPAVTVECEHVSYRLNDSDYDMEYFAQTGTPTAILTAILNGTGFTAGTVDFATSVTYSAQEKKSRRALLMEFVATLGGEVEFSGFTVSIKMARGSATAKDLTANKNLTILSKSVDKRTLDALGNPTISYQCALVNPVETLSLGDAVIMEYALLDIDVELRIVSLTTNPYDARIVSFEVGNYVNTLEDSLYRIETSTVSKDKAYNGCRIGPTYGFEAVRSDKKARAYLNSTNIALQAGDGTGTTWTNKLYYDFDPETGVAELYFDGKLTAEAIEAISATIDVVISETVIVQNLYAAKGYIAELTVDQWDTSKKVQNYIDHNTSNVNYARAYDQNIEFNTATVSTKQGWQTYPKSPLDTSTYLYQAIIKAGTAIRLILSSAKWYYYYDSETQLKSGATGKMYQYTSSAWEFVGDAVAFSYTEILQANYDIYDSASLSNVLFDATIGDYEQVTDRNGNKVYWVDSSHTGTTIEPTEAQLAFPVKKYWYDELTKMLFTFEDLEGTGTYTPIILMGAGDGVTPLSAKARIYKNSTGCVIEYFKSSTADRRAVILSDSGIAFDPPLSISNNLSGVPFLLKDANTAAITVATDTDICSIINTFAYRSKALLHFSAMVETTASVTTKVYLDTAQQAFVDIQASDGTYANIDLTIPISPIEAGEHTIKIQMTGSGNVAISQAQMSIIVFVNPQPSTLNNISGLTATAASISQIDLTWVNPTDTYFSEVEVYRSTEDISGYSRTQCASGATLIYNGAGTSYSDTGLSMGTTYYYKVFAKYIVEGTTYYSDGVSDSEMTVAESPYQQWDGYPDSPVLTADYPYQCIVYNTSTSKYVLYMTSNPVYLVADGVSDNYKTYVLTDGVWVSNSGGTSNYSLPSNRFLQSNFHIYNDSTKATMIFVATTKEPDIDEYQAWANFNTSIYKTADYQHQLIRSGVTTYLVVTNGEFYVSGSYIRSTGEAIMLTRNGSSYYWYNPTTKAANTNLVSTSSNPAESNVDIYTDSSLTTVWFAKTT